MKTRSSKAKGMRLQNWVRDELLSRFKTLNSNDIYCAIMGETGTDIKLSNTARKFLPYSFECKNRETFKGTYDIIKQAQNNCTINQIPIGVIKMNKFEPLVIIDAKHFFDLVRK